MPDPVSAETKQAILAELEANEWRAGEFHQELGRKYGVSGWYVRCLSVSARRTTR